MSVVRFRPWPPVGLFYIERRQWGRELIHLAWRPGLRFLATCLIRDTKGQSAPVWIVSVYSSGRIGLKILVSVVDWLRAIHGPCPHFVRVAARTKSAILPICESNRLRPILALALLGSLRAPDSLRESVRPWPLLFLFEIAWPADPSTLAIEAFGEVPLNFKLGHFCQGLLLLGAVVHHLFSDIPQP